MPNAHLPLQQERPSALRARKIDSRQVGLLERNSSTSDGASKSTIGRHHAVSHRRFSDHPGDLNVSTLDQRFDDAVRAETQILILPRRNNDLTLFRSRWIHGSRVLRQFHLFVDWRCASVSALRKINGKGRCSLIQISQDEAGTVMASDAFFRRRGGVGSGSLQRDRWCDRFSSPFTVPALDGQ